MTIGVFDSGIGGEAVAMALRKEFPTASIESISDSEHVPYGGRSGDEVLRLTEKAIQPLLQAHVDVLVIACNTATTLALPALRERYPEQVFVGIEPMLKPAAAHTKSGVICVCATPSTLASERYAELKQSYADSCKVIEPDCSTWAYMIEQRAVDEVIIREQIHSALEKNADEIVLGCTHYHWIKELIERECAGRAEVLEPSVAIGRRIRQLLNL